jgi:hypothetical protein
MAPDCDIHPYTGYYSRPLITGKIRLDKTIAYNDFVTSNFGQKTKFQILSGKQSQPKLIYQNMI